MHNIEIKVGFELEFQILKENTKKPGTFDPLENGPYCSLDSVDIHHDILMAIDDAFKSLNIEIELIHNECAPS